MESRIQRGALIIEKAREWIGTPYRHASAVKGRGSDCIGFAFAVYKELGLIDPNLRLPKNYSREPSDRTMQIYLDKHLKKTDEIRDGYVGLFTFDKYPQHLCIFSTIPQTGLPGMIHASLMFKRIVEHHFSSEWRQWLTGVYKWPT